MQLVMNICKKSECVGCGACANTCPVEAITMQADSEGFLYPDVSEECINCDKCRHICPGAHKKLYQTGICDVYAIQLLDEELLKRSTSGGMFILLAMYVLERQGVVFGASYDASMVVKHTCAETLQDVFPMQGSKYVQSEIGDSYYRAKCYLDTGRYVLFSGTPCQIEGLTAYLEKPYEKLILLDIICSGTPSPLLFKLYLENLEKQNHSRIIDYNFRSKTQYGCSHTTEITELIGGKTRKTVIPDRRNITYYNAFGQQAYLRPSCYGCIYNNPTQRRADFTCGDYFGTNRAILALGEFAGISEIIIHSDKGRKIFEESKQKIKCMKISLEDAKEGNKMLYSSMTTETRRPEMFAYLTRYGYERTAKSFFPAYKQSVLKRMIPVTIKAWIKKIIIRFIAK